LNFDGAHMKTLTALAFAALMLVTASAASYAGEDKKNTAQNQAAMANQQLSIKLLRLRLRAHQTPPTTPLLNQ
jgi:CHASE3 domain sensor protein